MNRIRQFMRDKPWIGWVVALFALAGAGVIIFKQQTTTGMYDPESMTQIITIKFLDTGDEVEIPRGRVDTMLREQQSGVVDPSKGLLNPKTGQPTGFPIDKRNWDAWIKRINEDRAQYGGNQAPTPPPAPKPGN
jgi:hypothetical protein